MNNLTQWVLILALAPLVQGVIKTMRARLSGRPGPRIWQCYHDLRKLWSKEAIVAENTSAIVLMAPGVVLGVAVIFAGVVPQIFGSSQFSDLVDVIALIFMLALGRFFTVLAGLDTRSGFAGMAASREMTFAALTEAPLILALLGASLRHTSSLADLHTDAVGLSGVLSACAVLLVLLSETARIPVDNQETHYELTMIHEGLVLEYSGWHLAILNYGTYVRQAAFFVLAASLLPGSGAFTLLWVAAFIATMPLIETVYAKMRLFEVPQIFASAFVLSAASLAIRIVGIGRLW
jgi:formate hydrogenlyase subunit 4